MDFLKKIEAIMNSVKFRNQKLQNALDKMMTEETLADLDITLSDDEDYTNDENHNKEAINADKPEEKPQVMMRCAEITGAGKPLKITCRARPQVPEEGVLVKTLYGGICHSDIHFIDDKTDLGEGKSCRNSDVLGKDFCGLVPGHEICGVVEDIGKQVTSHSLKVGDTVIVYPWAGCLQCELCANGQSNMCEDNPVGSHDIGQGKYSGGYGAYVAVPEIQLCIKLPKSIPAEIGCMLPCSALTAYGALTKAKPALEAAVRIRGVANLLLIGLGGLGMWSVIIVKHVFCDKNIKIICADSKIEKLDIAEKLGADDVIEWKDSSDVNELVAQTTVNGYNKIDATIDYVGLPRTVQIAFDSLHNGGTIVVIGLRGGSFPLSLPMLTAKSASIQGLRTGGIQDLRQLVDVLAVQNIQIYPPVEIVNLDQVNDTIERLRKGEVGGRAIIKHSESE